MRSPHVLFADHDELVSLLRDSLAARARDETIVRAVRRATLAGVDRLLDDPAQYLTRSRLAATIPAAGARSRQLDADYETVIAEAFAAARGSDAATDLHARTAARASWSASRAARDVWLAGDGQQDPKALVNDAFDIIERGLA